MNRLNERRNLSGRNARDVLETPVTVGYRPGMSSSRVIGRKLGALYQPPVERTREIETALETLDNRIG